MKYSGSITIVDDQGEAVYEREFTDDELVQELLRAGETVLHRLNEVATPPVPSTPAPARTSRDSFKDGLRKAKGATQLAHSIGGAKPCCGSLGKRHKKDCSGDVSSVGTGKIHALTEDEYDQVKDARSQTDAASVKIADDLDLPLQQVNYAILSPTFKAYLGHYEYQQ